MIQYSGDPQGSHPVHLAASKVLELAAGWPESSPFRKKIVLLGGSYLDQDRHETPIGVLPGLEIMANVIETELAPGGGREVPSEATVLILDASETFVLILFFHTFRMRVALLFSLLAIPEISVLCSLAAYHTWTQLWRFIPILVGMIAFELYEHYRRQTVAKLFHEITQKQGSGEGH